MQFFRSLAAVTVRPRATMRAMLDGARDRRVVVLFALAVVSGIFGDLEAPLLRQVLDHPQGWQIGLLVAGVAILVAAAMVAVLYFYAWVPLLIGRFLEGTGEIHGVRSAMAWGLAPAIWALLYRIPASFWGLGTGGSEVRFDGRKVRIDPGALADGCGLRLLIATIEVAVFVWCIVVLSNTLGEAHRFSSWRGLGTLLLSMLVPIVVVIAALLSI